MIIGIISDSQSNFIKSKLLLSKIEGVSYVLLSDTNAIAGTKIDALVIGIGFENVSKETIQKGFVRSQMTY
jgi:hypothetical protein